MRRKLHLLFLFIIASSAINAQNAYIKANPTSFTFRPIVESKILKISSNTKWEITGEKPWFSFSQNTGSCNAEVKITTKKNVYGDDNFAYAYIQGDNASSVRIEIKQLKPLLYVSPRSITIVNHLDSIGKVKVSTNADWEVYDVPSWLKLSDYSGTGSDTVIVKLVSINKSGKDRVGSLNFYVRGLTTKKVTVTQLASSPLKANSIIYKLDDNNTETYLGNAYPNPSTSETTIPLFLSDDLGVKIEVLNISGKKVATIVEGNLNAGEYSFVWKNISKEGISVKPGLYIYRLITSDGSVQARKLIVK